MKILGIEKVSLVDYEGKICATVFTGGCNLRCPFCHNSGIVNQQYQKHNTEEILQYLRNRRSLLDAVTISGGEPTLQPDLESFITEIKSMGYLVKLDTNGTSPEMLKMLLDKNLIDYVAMDIKNNFDDYSEISGVPDVQIDKIRESLSLLKNSKIDYELRTTLVEEFHKTENIEKLALDLAGHKKLYLQKFVDNGSCLQQNLNAVAKEDAMAFQSILNQTVKQVFLRGY